MAKPAEILIERIDQRLLEQGKSRYWLSQEVSDGKSVTVVRDIARRKSMPAADRLERIARALATTTEWLLGETADPGQVRSEVRLSDKHIEWIRPERDEPGIPLVGTGDCADIELKDDHGRTVEVARASFDNDFTVRMFARPPALRGVRDLYAIQFVGDSMEPRYESGEVAIVNPHRPVSKGSYVLVQITNGEDPAVTSVLAKRFVGQNAREIVLEQFNPPLTFVVPKRQVARVHHIMPQTELLLG